jgi:hypothetical protein
MANSPHRFGCGGIGIANRSSRRETGEAGWMSGDDLSHLIVVAPDEVGNSPATAHLEPVFEIMQGPIGEEERAGAGSICSRVPLGGEGMPA